MSSIENTDNKVYRLRSCVGKDYRDKTLMLLKTNTRDVTSIKIGSNIIEILEMFDGKNSVGFINKKTNVDPASLRKLIDFLVKENILIEVDCFYSDDFFNSNYRIVNLIEDYCTKTSDVMDCYNKIKNKKVLIVGLGAVGTWVAHSLASFGANNLVLVDNDLVELSNIHRQDLFFFNDVGLKKTEVAKKRLHNMGCTNVKIINDFLGGDFFEKYDDDYSLIINCADKPSVDYTTMVVGEYGMKKNIPHIIGGGYNLHLNLIGQTVIPHLTACCRCFDIYLSEKVEEFKGIFKVNRQTRKIGSFGPLCSVSATMAALDAFKVLIGRYDKLINSNKRLEFNVNTMDFKHKDVLKNKDCDWCGENGKYKNKK